MVSPVTTKQGTASSEKINSSAKINLETDTRLLEVNYKELFPSEDRKLDSNKIDL